MYVAKAVINIRFRESFMDVHLGPYDPCPCGSGNKYKFCCAAKARENRHGKYPIGTVAYYGPDNKTTTKIVASVVMREDAEPILERFFGMGVTTDPKVAEQIKRFFATHGVKTVVSTGQNFGCPHEEGIDFPEGADCPQCPFWAGKQQNPMTRINHAMSVPPDDEVDDEEIDTSEASVDPADAIDDDDDVDEDDAPDNFDGSFARSVAIVGEDETARDRAVEKYFEHLKAHLPFPVDVTGTEDFGWEERYLIGGWSQSEYRKLKQTQPSYSDCFELMDIVIGEDSPWIMCRGEDLGEFVRRRSDGRQFILGLSELKVIDKSSPSHQLLNDYAVWFWNSR